MEKNDYIDSGILELYITGALTEQENQKVYNMILKHPELLIEIKAIEKSLSILGESLAPESHKDSFKNVLIKMLQDKEQTTKIIPIAQSKNTLITYTGWAASIILTSSLIFFAVKNSDLNKTLENRNQNKLLVEQRLDSMTNDLLHKRELLAVIRNPQVIPVPLQGQAVAPKAYAKVYWDKKSKTIYLDAKGLPEPPQGKVYQVWSLKLNPLSPTSLGTIDDFVANSSKIFTIKNINESQGFGITLEPEGGSKTPTLEQLYTLGALNS